MIISNKYQVETVMARAVLGNGLLLVTVTLTILKSAASSDLPQEEYLKKWTEKTLELSEIPKCRHVPQLSEEEVNISRKCPKNARDALCSNIFQFSERRKLCRPFLENVESFRNVVRGIINEVGLEAFSTMSMNEIVETLEEKTKIKTSVLIHKEMEDIVMEVIDEIATKAGFTKVEPENVY